MFVYIQTTEKEWRPGSVLIPKDYPEHADYIPDFAEYMAELYQKELVRAIDEQRYVYKWGALSVPYYEYKEKKNLSVKFWERTGLLKNSITYWQEGDKWVVGIDKNKRYPDTPVKVYKVARYLEYGTSRGIPPRKLFRPLARYLSKNVRRFWYKFLDEKGLEY